jgi:Cu+-exporting ATPase
MVGTGESASAGILVKSAEVLETAHKIDTLVLDKTGTLTLGKPLVSKIFTNRFFSEVKLLQIAASIEKPSEHPLAAAILDEADFRSIEILPVEQFEVFPAQGVKAMMNERIYMAGNLKFVQENAIKTGNFEEKAALIASEGGTPLFIANATEVLGVIGMTDVLKPGSADAVRQIREMGIKVIMLTGDHMQAAEHIRRQAGIEQVIADVLPAEKESVIRKLQDEGKSVMMVGDGINDAPALMRAQVGMAIGAGSDIAIESADVVLIGNELSSAGTFIRLSRKVMKNIRQNLFWAFIYNILGIPLAAGVFYIAFGWQLSPVFAAAAMSFSSVTVVLNSLRIRSIKTP